MTACGRLLIAVDGSSHALHAVRYVAQMCAGSHLDVRLFSVLPGEEEEVFRQVPMDEDFMHHMHDRYLAHAADLRLRLDDFLTRCRAILVEAGIPGNRVELAARLRKEGIARDILAEAHKGYDAVVVGRRGLGKVESILLGSVSGKIVQALQEVPVWVVGSPVPSMKVMLAVDASANSWKAVDYAAPFLSHAQCEVLLYHVVRGAPPSLGPAYAKTGEEIEEQVAARLKEEIVRMLGSCRARLVDAGVRAERVGIGCTIGSIGRAAEILGTARQGGYGTIVMGRRGISMVRRFVMGRVTNKVLNGAENLAVWVVP